MKSRCWQKTPIHFFKKKSVFKLHGKTFVDGLLRSYVVIKRFFNGTRPRKTGSFERSCRVIHTVVVDVAAGKRKNRSQSRPSRGTAVGRKRKETRRTRMVDTCCAAVTPYTSARSVSSSMEVRFPADERTAVTQYRFPTRYIFSSKSRTVSSHLFSAITCRGAGCT